MMVRRRRPARRSDGKDKQSEDEDEDIDQLWQREEVGQVWRGQGHVAK